jgi:energy-coupling factor transporter ATP-binding protein EcfA2
MPNDSRGSIWRQWDLHCHTPASFDYGDKSVLVPVIVERLVAEGVAVVAVVDHHVIDIDRILSMRQAANGRLVIFPAIELRSELGGGECVHYVGIFSEQANVTEIWTKVQGRLDLTGTDIQDKGGDDRVYVPFTKGAGAIRELGGIVTVHAGKKTNSIERIGNAYEFKQAFKEDMARDFIDILEIGRPEDAQGYRDIVFPDIGFSRPLVLCSDNHRVQDYSRKAPCWIKADTTFAGLRQVLNEPEGRVYLGDTPPVVERVAHNKTKYIRSVSFSRSTLHSTDEAWFDGKVPFNNELVAIIGNKGGGKSALADVIGLLGDSSHSDSFSFLNGDKFREPKGRKARCFDATLEWESGDAARKNLDDPIDPAAIERVKYIPQNYLERICNELAGPGGNTFTGELRSVIFSHVDEADRLGTGTLDELIAYKTKETDSAIALLRSNLRDLIGKALVLEERMSPTHKAAIENHLAQKKQELEAHDASRPPEVKKPESDPAAQEKTDAIARKIEEKAAEITALEAKIAALKEDRTKDLKNLSAADRLLERIQNLKTVFDQFKTDSAEECSVLGLSLDDLVKIQVDIAPLELKRTELDGDAKSIADALKPDNKDGPEYNRVAREKEIAELKKELDEPNRRYQAFLKATKDWEVKRKAIVGTPDSVGTVKYYEHQLASLTGLPKEAGGVQFELVNTMLAIHGEIAKLATVYRTLYQPVQDFIKKHPLAQGQFHLEFRADVVPVDFEERFLAFINQGRRGSFCGVDEGRSTLRDIVRRADFQSEAGVRAFVDEIMKHLTKDLRPEGDGAGVSLEDQLTKGSDKASLLEFLFSLGYLKPDYSLRWSGKDVDQLSPGERGTLLLVFYLLIDRSDIPLIIDQPEENLDNQTVYDILVPSIKEAKSRRQIVIVTHNPNLAVVCDAEQIIWASVDKNARNMVTYTTGAIENPAINRKVVDILEGTQPAFDNREAKYKSANQALRGDLS